MRLRAFTLGLFGVLVGCASGRAQHVAPHGFSCSPVSEDSLLALVQSSDAFRAAIHALVQVEAKFGATVDEARVQRLCEAMQAESPDLLRGAVLVHTPALFGLDRSFMIFAVHQGRVLLINPRPDGNFRFGLHPSDWNDFLESADLSPEVTDEAAARRYGCVLLAYLRNYLPGGLCMGPVDIQVRRTAGGTWHVAFPRFRWQVVVSDDGRIVQ